MADEQYRWLNRETAERLLRGESPGTADPAAREQAARLAAALDALSAPSPSAGGELPGEAAALAAFRQARADRAERAGSDGHAAPPASTDTAPASSAHPALVRIGRSAGAPRRSRPVRWGLAAALAAGMAGGVAAAAGTGVLPTPFDGAGRDPGSSVSSAATPPERPPASSSPRGSVQGGATPGGPSDNVSAGIAGGGDPGTPSGGATTGSGADDPADASRDRWRGAASACRDLRDGKALDAGRKRALEGAAGGSHRVPAYCEGVLSVPGSGSPDRAGEDRGGDRSTGQGNGKAGDKSNSDKSNSDKSNSDKSNSGNGNSGSGNSGDGDGGGNGNGTSGGDAGKGRSGGHRDGALAPRAPRDPQDAKARTLSSEPSPEPTYSAL
ncbi:hypothetical protein ACIF8T_17675 [Streptomyces sp. NPDC085946]|uniref:hypothetical protein n=1 Tax=Streptomyces sp. NPDC085946 TaxID=3365744 RepID=UPI0037D52E58